MTRLAGQVALVTGASRGIGAAIARRLAAEGAAVAVHYRTRREAAERVVEEIVRAGGRAAAFAADLADVSAIGPLFDRVEAALGTVDILVNNAGALAPTPMGALDPAAVDLQLAVNVRAPLVASSEMVRRRRGRPGGRIVHIGSGAGHRAFPGHAAYAASKGALEGMTPSMAQDLGPLGITVNTVAPGATATEMLTPDNRARLAPQIALGRVGEPDDIAAVVAFLVSPDGGWITGQVIDANGGLAL
ncbi:MAG TPA: glucose 1-dehydrogenase [Thermodesulfobacteriota bacterium]